LSAEERKLAAVRSRIGELGEFVQSKKGRLGALVLDLESGERAEVNAALPLNPASNMKLITAAAALDLLGPGYSFETALYGSPAPEMSTLVLRGNGDPSLGESGLWRLASALSSLGVSKVQRLLVDQSRFDEQFVPPAFEQQPSEWATFRAPVSAIALERNTVTLNVAAGKRGEPARSWFQPAGVAQLQGQVNTRPPGGGQNIQLDLSQSGAGLVGKVGGHIAEGLPRQRFGKRVDDPRLLPGLCLQALLGREGVSVGSVELGGSEEKARITYQASAPLSGLLAELGKNSDNFYAETVFKALATTSGKGPATWQAAADVVTRWLQGNGSFGDGMRIRNGSGLFDANRSSAESLCNVLRVAHSAPRLGSEYIAHLAIGGVDGTLRSRFRGLRDARRVRAKTGTLASVDALSGYVLRNGRAPLVFSFMVNDLPGQHGPVRAKVDEIVTAMAAL
jgi:serine-type D-Ala-D-Ala carboxypeptidase/endopeptidase (penicillin-binding protein 4)